jgi:hypothetical protein
MHGTKCQHCSAFVLGFGVVKLTIDYFELIWLVEGPFSAKLNQHGSLAFNECMSPTIEYLSLTQTMMLNRKEWALHIVANNQKNIPSQTSQMSCNDWNAQQQVPS